MLTTLSGLFILTMVAFTQQNNNNTNNTEKINQIGKPTKLITHINFFNLSLQLNQQQTLLQSIRSLLPLQQKLNVVKPLMSKISKLQNVKTYQQSQSLCNIIRAPMHKHFDLVAKINHKIQDFKEWQKLAVNNEPIYKLEDLSKLEYALDMEVIDDKIVVIFQDGEVIVYQLADRNIRLIWRQSVFSNKKQAQYLSMGKLFVHKSVILFISSTQMIYINIYSNKLKIINGYQGSPYFYTALLNQKEGQYTVLVAMGKSGIAQYSIDFQKQQAKKLHESKVTLNDQSNKYNISVIDIIDATEVYGFKSNKQPIYLALDPNHGIIKLIQLESKQLTSEVSKFMAQKTPMRHKNCRVMKLHNKNIYVSCPQIIKYNILSNSLDSNVIITQLPLQILSSENNLVMVSHTSFQILDDCSGAMQQGSMDGYSFQHTVPIKDYFVSIDDLSIVLWKMKYAQYFIACKGNKYFKGENKFQLQVSVPCNVSDQCCFQSYQGILKILNSQQGAHLFQAIGIAAIAVLTLALVIWIVILKINVNKQYRQLQEQPQIKNEQTTEQSMYQVQKKTDYQIKVQKMEIV